MIIKLQTPYSQFRLDVTETDNIHTTIKKHIPEHFTCTFNNHPITPTDTFLNLKIKQGQTIIVNYQKSTPTPKKKDDSIKRNMGVLCNHDRKVTCINCLPLDVYDKNYYKENNIKYISFNAYLKKVDRKEKTCECIKVCDCIRVRPLMPQEYRFIDHIQLHCKNQIEEIINGYRGSLRQRIAFLVGNVNDYEMVPLGRKVDVMYVYEIGQENYPDGVVICDEVVSILRVIAKEQNEVRREGRRIGDCENVDEKEREISALIEEYKMYLNESEEESSGINEIENDRNEEALKYGNIRKERKEKENLFSSTTYFDNRTFDRDRYRAMDKKQRENVKSILALRILLKKHNLKIVGILYTDFQKLPREEFLSPLEAIFIAELQLMFSRNVNDFLYTEFVTLLLSKVENDIELFEYQLSEQCMCLVRNQMLAPTKKALISNCELYYFEKDEYGNVVRKSGYDIPVDFFIVKLTHGYKAGGTDDYFHWQWNEKRLVSYFDNDFEKKFNLNVWIRLMMMGHLNLERLEDEMVCKLASTEAEWACERCTFVNEKRAGLCEMCGQGKHN